MDMRITHSEREGRAWEVLNMRAEEGAPTWCLPACLADHLQGDTCQMNKVPLVSLALGQVALAKASHMLFSVFPLCLGTLVKISM